jgi:ribosomal protein S12 methylthiotransferase
VIEARRDRLMAVQQPIAFAFNRGQVGKTLDVMIDAPSPEGRHRWIGRTYADAPDVDGVVQVRGGPFQPGDIVPCEIVDAEGYDLIARASPSEPPRARRGRPRPRKRPAASSLVVLDDV